MSKTRASNKILNKTNIKIKKLLLKEIANKVKKIENMGSKSSKNIVKNTLNENEEQITNITVICNKNKKEDKHVSFDKLVTLVPDSDKYLLVHNSNLTNLSSQLSETNIDDDKLKLINNTKADRVLDLDKITKFKNLFDKNDTAPVFKQTSNPTPQNKIINNNISRDYTNDDSQINNKLKKIPTNKKNEKRELTKYSNVTDSLSEEEVLNNNSYCYSVIHPESYFKIGLDIISIFVISYASLITPLHLALDRVNDSRFCSFETCIDIVLTIKIFPHFFLAFYNKEDKLITNKSMIAINYLTSWFIIDLISSTPCFLLFINFFYEIECQTLNIFRWLRILRIFKITSTYLYITIEKWLNFKYFFFLKNVICFFNFSRNSFMSLVFYR